MKRKTLGIMAASAVGLVLAGGAGVWLSNGISRSAVNQARNKVLGYFEENLSEHYLIARGIAQPVLNRHIRKGCKGDNPELRINLRSTGEDVLDYRIILSIENKEICKTRKITPYEGLVLIAQDEEGHVRKNLTIPRIGEEIKNSRFNLNKKTD
jgi:hypothetical protein|tara:strand:- start:4300 stop:4761 length:462 start_codon:yes stop_codon:yes gene_type:complete